jgi:N-acetylglutamate synthase-like GNAT family acetyltransferase
LPEVTLRDLDPADAPACDAVLATLPTFFGDPQGNADCAEAVRTQKGFVGTIDGEVVAFLTLAPSTDDALEVTWMAVRDDMRRSGIGRRLIDRAVAEARERGYPVLSVLTLGPSDPDEGYKGTRAFYRAMGFFPIKELKPESWNQTALVCARPV